MSSFTQANKLREPVTDQATTGLVGYGALTLKIGCIDPLSGGGASVGEVGLKTFQFLADIAVRSEVLPKLIEQPFDQA